MGEASRRRELLAADDAADRLLSPITIEGGADVEGDHRYHLWREWDRTLGSVCWIMLNPSLADAKTDDPTIRKCIGFARRWGFGRIDVVNLYTLRTPSPAALRRAGYANRDRPASRRDDLPPNTFEDISIKAALVGAMEVVCAWGVHAQMGRVWKVLSLVRKAGHVPKALRVTKGGAPEHPLYVPYDVERRPYAP